MKTNFECKSKTKTESDKGIIYKVRFVSKDGYVLTLRGLSSEIFQGYMIGENITVEIMNPQTTLSEESEE